MLNHHVTTVWMQAVFQSVLFPTGTRGLLSFEVSQITTGLCQGLGATVHKLRNWTSINCEMGVFTLRIQHLGMHKVVYINVYHLSYWSNVLSCCLISDLIDSCATGSQDHTHVVVFDAWGRTVCCSWLRCKEKSMSSAMASWFLYAIYLKAFTWHSPWLSLFMSIALIITFVSQDTSVVTSGFCLQTSEIIRI